MQRQYLYIRIDFTDHIRFWEIAAVKELDGDEVFRRGLYKKITIQLNDRRNKKNLPLCLFLSSSKKDKKSKNRNQI
jgi:hypothetical protein